jgi:hypothetical protein
MNARPPDDSEIRATLGDYLGLLQKHIGAEEMMSAILTDDFETGSSAATYGGGSTG